MASLQQSLQVRALAMKKLEDSAVLKENSPSSNLQVLFPLVYLWHRYEVETVVKLVGGSLFQYSLKSSEAKASAVIPISGAVQLAALEQVRMSL